MGRRLVCEPCDKSLYSSQGAALGAAVRHARKYETPMRVYKCPRGNGWHLTTKPQREVRDAG